MSSLRDPPRLTDPGSGAPSELVDAIRELREERGSLEQARAIRQRLASELGPGVLSGTKVGSACGSSLLSALVIVTLAGMPLVPASLGPKPGASAPMAAIEQAAARSAPVIAVPEPTEARVSESRSEFAPPRPRLTRKHRPRGPQHQAVLTEQPAGPAVEAEIALLQRARRELRRDPLLSLQLAEQHARDYPHGVFVEEREVLAIEALLKRHRLEPRRQAFARAQAFVAAHPSSSYAFRIQKLIDEWAGPEAPGAAEAATAAAVRRGS